MSEKSTVIPDVIKLSKVANAKELKQELMSKDKTNRLRNYLSDKEVKEYCFKLLSNGFRGVKQRTDDISINPALINPEYALNQLTDYFNMSFSYNMVPSLPSMLSYLGLSQSEYNYALKHPDMFPALSLLEEGQRQCGIILENVALNDKIDPRLFVFLGKNYYGLQDKTDIQVSRGIDEVQISSDSVEVLKQQLSAEDNTTIIDTTPL